MGIKINSKKAFSQLGKLLPAANTGFSIEMKQTMVDIVKAEYDKGTSPVKGYNPYKKKKDGSKSTMKVSGDMQTTMKATQHRNGRVSLSIGDNSAKYARAHQDGEGKMPKRPLLPEKRNQKFKKGVLDKFIRAAKKAIRLAVVKYG